MNKKTHILINMPQGDDLERYLAETTRKAEIFKEIFDRLIAEKPNLTLTRRGASEPYEMIHYVEGEEWRQMFSREDRGRWEFPPYLFISDRTGFVISVKNPQNREPYLKWLDYDKRANGTYRYHFIHPWADKGESAKLTSGHIIQALVFKDKVERTPLADEIIQEHGLLAFCQGKKSVNVNHFYTKEMCPEAINDVNSLQVLSEALHIHISNPPKCDSKDKSLFEKEKVYTRKLSRLLHKEYKGVVPTAIFAGYEYDMKTRTRRKSLNNGVLHYGQNTIGRGRNVWIKPELYLMLRAHNHAWKLHEQGFEGEFLTTVSYRSETDEFWQEYKIKVEDGHCSLEAMPLKHEKLDVVNGISQDFLENESETK